MAYSSTIGKLCQEAVEDFKQSVPNDSKFTVEAFVNERSYGARVVVQLFNPNDKEMKAQFLLRVSDKKDLQMLAEFLLAQRSMLRRCRDIEEVQEVSAKKLRFASSTMAREEQDSQDSSCVSPVLHSS